MKQQQGFTLIELVVVIVILGILAVTAAPRFINLQGDARLSALQGLKGAIEGANSLVYSRAAIDGVESFAHDDATNSSDITIQGQTVSLQYGYVQATVAELEKAMAFDADEWQYTEGDGTIEFWPTGVAQTASVCSLTYTEPSGGTNLVYTITYGPTDIDATDCGG
ncbi:type II secretion system GspH family protein [Neiella marina]|uniref:Type II secretion system GspH family protein n=1 Tax=Neiella holothuriorum TaxID=2870530 RepID=A0ABS7EAR6_9GAMM|nr:type II secretion system protein [Neiella holothuriorum]MBW8189444.1 type II secretion system GspH family protein [Neiella holothuriorum]